MKLRNCFLCVFFAALTATGCGGTKTPEQIAAMGAPKVGDSAPSLSLKTLDGSTTTLAGLLEAGPVVFVQLRGWVTYQCPLCTRQAGEFLGRAADFKAAGAQLVFSYPGAADGLEAHAKEFIAEMALPEGFHFVLDPDLATVKALGLHWDAPKETAYPATFVIDTNGKVRFAKISDGHGGRAGADEALAALKSLAGN